MEDGCKVFVRDPDDKMGGIDYLRLDKNKDKAYQFDCAAAPSRPRRRCTSTVRRVVRAVLDGSRLDPARRAIRRAFLNRRRLTHVPPSQVRRMGSGKTFTMMGEDGAPGVMPIAVKNCSTRRRRRQHDWRFGVTYVEIYNERVKDLLNPEAAELEVLRTRGRARTSRAPSRWWACRQSWSTWSASLYRVTEATNCNAVSSRSHAVLQVSVEALQKFGDAAAGSSGSRSCR